MNYIADCLHVERSQLAEVLGNWTREQYLKHVQVLTSEDLGPPGMRP